MLQINVLLLMIIICCMMFGDYWEIYRKQFTSIWHTYRSTYCKVKEVINYILHENCSHIIFREMTPYPLIPPKVYTLLSHTRNKVLGVYLKQNEYKNDYLWCNQRL